MRFLLAIFQSLHIFPHLNIQEKKIILRESSFDNFGEIISQEISIKYGLFIETFIDFIIV